MANDVSALLGLEHENSPYLQHHIDDPVTWHPWCDEVLNYARKEKRLIFLSIGYASCHWCHVMARESFADHEVAEILNSCFVPILVDCGERPDVNLLYMKACRVFLDGNGGWPLNVVLSPELVPLFAAVYMPKRSAHGRIGLLDTLELLCQQWRNDCEMLLQKGEKVVSFLRQEQQAEKEGDLEALLQGAIAGFKEEYDCVNGGFGPDPRFVRPHALIFLLRHFWRSGDVECFSMVEKTLWGVQGGGITDHVFGGVHRYATDITWRVPHFEKMLYDQAGLVAVYAEIAKLTGNSAYAVPARKIVAYVLSQLAASDGLFFAGEDSDSSGVEGGFFVWSKEEIDAVLGAEEADLLCSIFNISHNGNFRPVKGGRGGNVLYRSYSLSQWAEKMRLPESVLCEKIDRALLQLRLHRQALLKPQKDRQIILSWNALMISALVKSGIVFAEPLFVKAAYRAADRLNRLIDKNGSIFHCLQDGVVSPVPATASDYVFFAVALLDLYECNFDSGYIVKAIRVADEIVNRFVDSDNGGLYESASSCGQLILHVKQLEEREVPSANSMALELFGRLWGLTGDYKWQRLCQRILQMFSGRVACSSADYPWFAQGVSQYLNGYRKVVVAGPTYDAVKKQLLTAAKKCYAPDMVIAAVDVRDKDVSGAPELGAIRDCLGDFVTDKRTGSVAYVCSGSQCFPPVSDESKLRRILEK